MHQLQKHAWEIEQAVYYLNDVITKKDTNATCNFSASPPILPNKIL